ncbi:MAG: hypothetical protein E4H00_02655 [Myxococcales bacterium]|nr:MAG: hypothetical protein E4H00_02655 [Myxococcales bacterium]
MGYEQVEYFISGTAASYANVGELGSDGRWEVEEADTAEYKTRILLYQPIDASAFSGTVIIEWLNVSGGLDAAPDWISMHTEIVREGHIWVGMSVQLVGIEGSEGALVRLHLKAVRPERYAPLSHPGDSFSYDMYAQAAQAIRNPVGIKPLGDLVLERLIAIGESQSAGRLVTYVNTLGPLYDVFDGYLIHSRGGGSAPLSQDPQTVVPTPEVVNVRDDLSEPVLMFQTESDLILLNSLPSNQPDSSMFRLWEVAATAHADTYTLLVGSSDPGDDASVAEVIETTQGAPIPGIIECESAINSGPQHWVLKAGLHGLVDWITTGEPLPDAPRLLVTEDGQGFQLDQLGNALGGIRTNYVDAPVAVLSGLGQTGNSFCRIFGTTRLLDGAELLELYPTHQDYLDAVNSSTQTAVEAGFILPSDAALIIADAESSDIGGP